MYVRPNCVHLDGGGLARTILSNAVAMCAVCLGTGPDRYKMGLDADHTRTRNVKHAEN